MSKIIDKYTIMYNYTIRESIKRMDEIGIGFIAVTNEFGKICGVVTDGDFRRAILKGVSLDDDVIKIANKRFISIDPKYSDKEIKDIFKKNPIKHIPVIKNGKLVDLIIKEKFYSGEESIKYNQINLPVVIMAGGRGERLDPFTRILPKPLIPIGDKTVIEIIMDEYAKFGMKNFYISINYKGKMIKAYFEDFAGDYNISFIQEEKPLGTIGALKYLVGEIYTPFCVSNCDIIIKSDYTEIYKFHKKNGYIITIVCSLQHHIIPYGICEIENGGILKMFIEKPRYDLLVNTGMYIFNPEVLDYIPKNEAFDITDLIKIILKKGKRVGVFPISEKSWLDVGQWEEYKETIKYLKLF
ncbi:MAG: CBS domain-containing protein [Candidatus Marinimicrobia bacterium]|nr:CBS domain-containing protein [Candidatus Neomarinimicrobiota bacterium]